MLFLFYIILFIYIFFYRLCSHKIHRRCSYMMVSDRSGFSYDYLCDVNRVLHSWARRALSKKFDACREFNNRQRDILLLWKPHEIASDLRKSTIFIVSHVRFWCCLNNLLKIKNLIPPWNVRIDYFESHLPSSCMNRATAEWSIVIILLLQLSFNIYSKHGCIWI